MSELKFSILSYHPSFLTTESIDVGILFAYDDVYQFESTKNFTRVSHFDDELDIEYLKLYLNGIKREVEPSILSRKIDFDRYISFYVNELKFCKPHRLITDDLQKSIEDTKKIFLRYDYSKGYRPNNSQKLKYFNELLESSGTPHTKKTSLYGVHHNEKINYDFVVNDYGVKIFTFEGKNTNRLIETAKAWSFNAEEMKSKGITTIFIYDIEITDKSSYHSIMSILSKNGAVYNYNSGINFLSDVGK